MHKHQLGGDMKYANGLRTEEEEERSIMALACVSMVTLIVRTSCMLIRNLYLYEYVVLNELTPERVFGTNTHQISKVWANQPRVQGLADGQLILLSGIHLLRIWIHFTIVFIPEMQSWIFRNHENISYLCGQFDTLLFKSFWWDWRKLIIKRYLVRMD